MEFTFGEVAIRVVLVLVVALILTLGTVVVVKMLKIDIKDFKQRTGPKFMMIALMSNILFIYVVHLLLKLLDDQSIHVLSFSFSVTDFVYSLISVLLTLFTAFTFVFILKDFKTTSIRWSGHTFIRKGEGLAFLLAFIVLFVAALQEEVMFRGYFVFLFQGKSRIIAMLVSTIIFTVWHFIGNKITFYQTIDWFIGGLLLFFVYTASGSIWTAAIVHFSRNLTNVLVFNIASKHSLLFWEQPISPKQKSIYTAICSLIMAVQTFIFY